ncbi:HAD-IA family hydrolase [Microbacterium stercoris]|uniref:HAD-IA family hydrolase n=1 Tax=Microbacterium stercoris TaxID=2820289 RepID=A0A939QGL7_9MICO|nr:HAD-IA family hydrolase [Microbacterium stercoris]MBO3662403.1 HAD-IA family hydrolase [Microbacterium stercoris]MBO3664395.1 HAD-IA family hydrolase [Microbacterium stercoris]
MTKTLEARALLLDMDGTLVDSTAVVERIWLEWSAEHGLDPETVLALIHGRQAYSSMAVLLPERPAELNHAEGAAMLVRETEDTDGVVEIPGAGAFLASLAKVPHALVTSASLPLAQARMSAAGLAVPAVAITAEDVPASKPDPSGFLMAAEALGVDPADCVVFEDSYAGITAGRAAGMRVVGVGADAVAHDPTHAVPDLRGVTVTQEGDGVIRIAFAG